MTNILRVKEWLEYKKLGRQFNPISYYPDGYTQGVMKIKDGTYFYVGSKVKIKGLYATYYINSFKKDDIHVTLKYGMRLYEMNELELMY